MTSTLRARRPGVRRLEAATGGAEVATVLAEVGYRSSGEAEACRLWVLQG